HKPIGVNGLGTIEHKTSAAGRLYGKLTGIAPLVKGMTKIAPADYERAPYRAERKKDYAVTVQQHRAQLAAAAHQATQTARAASAPGPATPAATPNGRAAGATVSTADAGKPAPLATALEPRAPQPVPEYDDSDLPF